MPTPTSQTIGTRPRRPTTARQPVLGLPASLVLHGLAIASIFLVFHGAYQPPEESHAVPVDLVTLAEQTNVAAAPPPPQENEPIQRDLAPLPPPEIKMAEAEPAPDIKPPKFEIQKEKPPDTRQDITHLLAQLTAPEKPTRNAREEATQSAGMANAMTASLADMLRSQIRNCWSPIAGAPNPADQIVSFDLRLNPDGSIASIETLTVSSNPYTAAAVSAAERAIYQCSPYHLPRESYGQWRQFRPLRFDPRQMVQQ